MLSLYQFSSCPFCWKIKALMHLEKIPYQIVEVTPFGMKELDFTDHKKVPVLRDGETVVTESNAIAHYLQQQYTTLPTPSEQDQVWLQWVDEVLVHYLPSLVHPNWRTSYQNFAHIIPLGQYSLLKRFFMRAAGAFFMPRVATKMRKRHHIKDASAEFTQALQHWVQEGLQSQSYFAGEQAGFVDAIVYGVLRSSADMDFMAKAQADNAEFAAWYQRCDEVMAR